MNTMNTTTETPAAIDTLRAMYRTVRGGAALDAASYVDALLDAAADGHDVSKIQNAFRGLGYSTRLDIVGRGEGAGARVRAAKATRGWKGAIRVASLFNMSEVWAAAMTAHYGPPGTHPDRRDAEGVPTVETLAEFPRISEAMAEAAERFENITAWYDRQNAGKKPDFSQVVEFYPPAKSA